MCWSCYLRYTDDPVVNDQVLAVVDLIRAQGDEASFSTLLHIMVGDMNLDDFWFDLDDPDNKGLRESYESAEPWEQEIFDALRVLSEPERATALAIEWGYLDRVGQKLFVEGG